MKFVDVTNDIAFRRIFGNENKTKILISFLNAILKFEVNQRIVEVQIANPYQFPRIAGEKASIIDVRAKDEKGRQFVIEMQIADVKGFAKRVQYYTARDYSMQIDSGDKYPKLRPTFFIGILDFNFFKGEDYLSNHIILDEVTYEHKLDDIKFTFIELKKFQTKLKELETLIEKWVFFIKNVENLDVIPPNIDDEGLLEAYKDADKHSWGKEDLIAYDNAFIAEQDSIGRIEFAEEKAQLKGQMEGELKERIKAVTGFYSNGIPIQVIAKSLNITESEIQEILKDKTNR